LSDKSILDLSRLQEAFDDDVLGIADLLEMALATGAKHVRTLRDGIEQNDITIVSRAAHGIKGSASNVGAGNVTKVATAIEDRARAANWDGILPLADELESAYAQLRESVAAYRAEVT